MSSICQMYFSKVPFRIEINGSHEGSIVVVFSAIMNIMQFIGGIKDVYDSFDLVRDLAQEYLEKQLYKEYGVDFDVRVRKIIPKSDYRDYIEKYDRRKHLHDDEQKTTYSSRDAFFWYLLISNIVLIAIIVLLILKAVMRVYG